MARPDLIDESLGRFRYDDQLHGYESEVQMNARSPMKSIADQLPPEIARQIHPDRRRNEAAYWAARDQLLDQYRGQWIGFAGGRVVASGASPVEVFHAAEATGLHPFFIRVGGEDEP